MYVESWACTDRCYETIDNKGDKKNIYRLIMIATAMSKLFELW